MKSLKTIIIAGIVLVAVLIATFVVIHLPDSSDAAVEESSAEDSTSTTSSSETTYVVNRDSDDLVRFTIVPTDRQVDDDTSYAYASEELDVTITRTEDESGSVSYSYDVSPDPGKFEYNTSMFRSMLYTVTSISASTVVEENAKDLTVYGLDQPTATIKTYYSDGTEVDIIIGSMAPVDEAYYCMTNESNTVYTIGSYVDSLLVRRPIEYRDITLFPTYTDDDIYTSIEWVSMTDYDGNVIEILLDSNAENEYNTESSQYVMLQPYQVSGNTSTIETNILDIASTLTLGSIIKDLDESEYAQYGLDNPAKLEMRDILGNEVHLLVGKTCPNTDYTYCMIDGTNTLITANSDAFTCIGQSYVQFMLRTVWSYNIEQLQSVDIQIGDEAYDMQVSHYVKQNANGNDADGVTGTLNGEDIIETNVRRLYIKCLYFRIIDNLTDDEKAEYADAEAYATITITLDDNESHTLELIPMTDRKYAMRLDGDVEYYCNKSSLTSLEKSLGYVQAGDELDYSFS
jgi:hypothetical protein